MAGGLKCFILSNIFQNQHFRVFGIANYKYAFIFEKKLKWRIHYGGFKCLPEFVLKSYLEVLVIEVENFDQKKSATNS